MQWNLFVFGVVRLRLRREQAQRDNVTPAILRSDVWGNGKYLTLFNLEGAGRVR